MEETEIVTVPYKGRHFVLKNPEDISKYKPESLTTFMIRHAPYGLDERIEVGKKLQETGLTNLADPVAAAALRAKVVGQTIINDWHERTVAGVKQQGAAAEIGKLPPDVVIRFSEIMHGGHEMGASEHKALML